MFKPAMAATVLIAFSVPAYAAGDFPMATMSTTLPREAVTVTDWYKQNVYDPNENKIGDIKDVLVDKSGKIAALILVSAASWVPAKRMSPCPLMLCIRP